MNCAEAVRQAFRVGIQAYGGRRPLADAIAPILGAPVPIDQLSRWQKAGGPMPDADVLVALLCTMADRTPEDLEGLLEANTRVRPKTILQRVQALKLDVDDQLSNDSTGGNKKAG